MVVLLLVHGDYTGLYVFCRRCVSMSLLPLSWVESCVVSAGCALCVFTTALLNHLHIFQPNLRVVFYRTKLRFPYDPRRANIFGTEMMLRFIKFLLTFRMNSNLQAMTALSIHKPLWKTSSVSFSCFKGFNEICFV
jgi:hypothetical protein